MDRCICSAQSEVFAAEAAKKVLRKGDRTAVVARDKLIAV